MNFVVIMKDGKIYKNAFWGVLHRTRIGQALIRNAEVTAEALARQHNDLPRTLVWEWFTDTQLQEMIDEQGEIEFWDLASFDTAICRVGGKRPKVSR